MRNLLIAVLSITLPAQEGFLPENVDSVTIPFEMLSHGAFPGIPIVKVKLKNQAAWFLVDTGFNSIAVDDDLAISLGLEPRGHDLVVSVGGTSKTMLCRAVPLRLGSAEFETNLFYAPDLDGVSEGYDRRIQGLLGAPFFGAFPVTLDYPARLMTIHDPEAFEPPESAVKIPISGGLGQPLLKASIDGSRPYWFMIDTGAEPGVILYAAFSERRGVLGASPSLPTTALAGVLGRVDARLGLLPELALGSTVIRDVPALVMSPSKEFGIDRNTAQAGILGSGLLASYRVTFDYASRAMFIARQTPLLRPSGMSFQRREMQLEVAGQVTTIGVEADLVPGDVVLEIEGEAPPDTITAVYDAIASTDEVSLSIDRDGETLEITVERLVLPRLRPRDKW